MLQVIGVHDNHWTEYRLSLEYAATCNALLNFMLLDDGLSAYLENMQHCPRMFTLYQVPAFGHSLHPRKQSVCAFAFTIFILLPFLVTIQQDCQNQTQKLIARVDLKHILCVVS